MCAHPTLPTSCKYGKTRLSQKIQVFTSAKSSRKFFNGTHLVGLVLDVMVVEAEGLEVEREGNGAHRHGVGVVITRIWTASHPLKQRLVHPPPRSATPPAV